MARTIEKILVALVAGAIFDFVFFNLLPSTLSGQSLNSQLLGYLIEIIVVLVFTLNFIKKARVVGLFFLVGILFIAPLLHDWLSFLLALIGLVLTIYSWWKSSE